MTAPSEPGRQTSITQHLWQPQNWFAHIQAPKSQVFRGFLPHKSRNWTSHRISYFPQVTEGYPDRYSPTPIALAKINWKLVAPGVWWTVQRKHSPPSFLTTYITPWAALARVERELSWSQKSKDQTSTTRAERAKMSMELQFTNLGQNLHAKPQ